MNRIFFRTIPRSLNWLAAFSLTVLLLKVFLLNKISEPIAGMSELGVIVEGILGSVIASYVFYLIVVHLKELADKRVIYPHVTKWACRVVGDCNSQLSAVSIQIEAPLDFHHLEMFCSST